MALPGSVTQAGCTDAVYLQVLRDLNMLDKPAMFTPGDNDWVDCDRPSNGGFNSLERLDHERQVFFSTPFSMGRHKLKQEVQSTPLCLGVNGPTPCVENRRWTFHDVTYATLNVQGSCNNLCDTEPDPHEYQIRNAADIAWLEQTFDEAKQRHSVARDADLTGRSGLRRVRRDARPGARPEDARRDGRPARRLP